MLESRVLLLRHWQIPPGGTGPRLWIIDPQSAQPLGFACRSRSRGLLSWCRRPFLAVHESGDEPLLCTLHKGFGFWASWRVRDADGHFVGQVCGSRLFDGRDDLLASLRAGAGVGMSAYVGSDDRELAITALESEGVNLTFLLGERDNPFVKMVLLAAALVHNQDVLAQTVRASFASSGS